MSESLYELVRSTEIKQHFYTRGEEYIQAVAISRPGEQLRRLKDQPVFGTIDSNILPAVGPLNKLPYIGTYSSCEGHLKRRPDVGFYLLGGYLSFMVDSRLPGCQIFFDGLEALLDRTEIATFRVSPASPVTRYNDFGRYGLPSLSLYFDVASMLPDRQGNTISADSFRRPIYVDRRLGAEVIGQYRSFWKNLGVLALESVASN